MTRETSVSSSTCSAGHSDPNTTERYYGHYDLTDLEQAMEQFAKRRR